MSRQLFNVAFFTIFTKTCLRALEFVQKIMTTVELFKSISRLWNCFLLSATTDGRDGLEMKLVKTRTVFLCLFVLFCFCFHFIACFLKF